MKKTPEIIVVYSFIATLSDLLVSLWIVFSIANKQGNISPWDFANLSIYAVAYIYFGVIFLKNRKKFRLETMKQFVWLNILTLSQIAFTVFTIFVENRAMETLKISSAIVLSAVIVVCIFANFVRSEKDR